MTSSSYPARMSGRIVVWQTTSRCYRHALSPNPRPGSRLRLPQPPELIRCQPPPQGSLPRLGPVIKTDAAGPRLFERKPGGGTTEQHDSRRQPEMRLMAHADHAGVFGQGGQERKELVRRSIG